MPLTHPNKYTTLSPNINTESFDHWSLPALETLAGCNYSKTGQTLLQIRPMAVYLLSMYFGEHLLTQLLHCSIDYTSCHLETFHFHHNFCWLGRTLILCYHCHQECFLNDKRSWRGEKKITASDVYLLLSVERRGWAGPSAGRKDGASEAGTSSAVAAHPGCSLWQGLRGVRCSMWVIRWHKWCVVQLKLLLKVEMKWKKIFF